MLRRPRTAGGITSLSADFVHLCAAQLAVATLDVQRLLVLSGEELDQEIGLMDQVLEKSEDQVRSRA